MKKFTVKSVKKYAGEKYTAMVPPVPTSHPQMVQWKRVVLVHDFQPGGGCVAKLHVVSADMPGPNGTVVGIIQ